MVKNEYKKHYDITIVGGGLAGRLMLAVLINCGLFDENKLSYLSLTVSEDIFLPLVGLNLNCTLGFK